MKNILLIPILLLLAYRLPAQEEQLYGHCDISEVWSSSPERERLEKQLWEMESQYRKDFRAMAEEYEASRLVDPEKWRTWSSEKQDSALLAWQRMEERMLRYRQRTERAINEKKNRLIEPVLDRIQKAIAEVAEEKGLSYVFDSSSSEGVIHAGKATDLTPAVIVRLNHKNQKRAQP